ncbi:hypothetical protein HPP92_005576 [Vanilla planifolia]|uniref:Uncharacterized protein n=1 Tax=Vanilla planifolia TaxID=51239 RepID=A0A835RZT9_VANPL|nr:hypothetical protein HPP92_005925 [Vanilla planifolia]KAG0494582.1 hypothetical protein HPP92_005576 [Vanilla planifolia]
MNLCHLWRKFLDHMFNFQRFQYHDTTLLMRPMILRKSMGLPPIPGSAPSVLLPRMNPFDIPYNLDENSSLNAESSRPYDVTASQKDLLLGRNERLQSGAASLEASQEDHEIKLKPFFVAENMSGTSFVSFERQLSEKSDSKESSTSESDSNSSVGNADQDLPEKVHELKLSVNHDVELVEQESESSEEDGSFDLEQELNAADTAEVGSEDEVGSSSALSSATNLEAIEESYDGSGSSYGSEGIKKHLESGIHVETINSTYTEGDYVTRSAQPSPSVVEPGITTKVVEGTEDSHVADPVYDSSPSSKSVGHVPSLDEAFLSESKGKEGFNTQSTSEMQADLHKADTTLLEGSFVQVRGNIDDVQQARYIDEEESDKESNDEKLKVSDGLSDDAHPEVNEVSDSIHTNLPVEELKTIDGIQSSQQKSTLATVAHTQLNSTTNQYLVKKLTTEFDTDTVSSSVQFSEKLKIENSELSQMPETSSPHKTDPIQQASVESIESFMLQ